MRIEATQSGLAAKAKTFQLVCKPGADNENSLVVLPPFVLPGSPLGTEWTCVNGPCLPGDTRHVSKEEHEGVSASALKETRKA
eukprot:2644763-Amphidinium_carterae.1